MDIIAKISEELKIRRDQTEAAVKLLDEGNTVPFIARYRKEATGALDDEQLRDLAARLETLRNLEDKKQTVLAQIEEQGKLTDELRALIEAAETQVAVDDLYRPYRPKRKTRASVAKERGLEPLAELILAQEFTGDINVEAEKYINEEKEVKTAADAVAGACDIISEGISDNADYRTRIREITVKNGQIVSEAKDKAAESVYESYYEYNEAVEKIPGHRILALNRGEKEKFLTVTVKTDEQEILDYLGRQVIHTENEQIKGLLENTVKDAYERLIMPSIEREIRNDLTERAEDAAIKVFGENLKQLLMQPPIAGHVVLGWDPAFRTGCKIAVVDPTGKVLDTTVIFPTAPQCKVEESKAVIKKLVEKHNVSIISLGNGTASRESEMVISELIKELPVKVDYIIVNEAGASVYSASKLATEEFPDLDVGKRSAASMARRLQDPLSELVKIDPKSVGVGQYQHDMNQKKLDNTLSAVVEDCVNHVGVDLNTASVSLLQYISGISKAIAKNIVDYREQNGRFTNRRQLLKVSKLGPKAFEQCAGFCRINDGDEPWDATGVHPESYKAADALIEKLGLDKNAIKEHALDGISAKISDIGSLSKELDVGEMTLTDIIKEMEKPARDPRDDMPKPVLRSDVLEMKDLTPGMMLKGTVRNVIDFGVFVDIGVHQDGLVHISELTDRYVKHPLDVVSIGDVVEVKVLDVDEKKGRISLTMKGIGASTREESTARGKSASTGNAANGGRKPEHHKDHGKTGDRAEHKGGKTDNRNNNNNGNKNGNKNGSFNKDRDNRSQKVTFANSAMADALRNIRR